MNNTVKRIIVILIILILLPAAFLTVNEFISLNQNEKVIEKIYSNQLDAILYSVNQYSEDIVSNWANRVDIFLDEIQRMDTKEIAGSIDSFYNQFPSLFIVFIADSIDDKHIEVPGWDENNKFISIDYDYFNMKVHNLLGKKQKPNRQALYL